LRVGRSRGHAAPDSGLIIPPALQAIHDARLERIGPHILTGPVAIAGAEPGDTLEVRIEAIEPNNSWGYCAVRRWPGPCRRSFPSAMSATSPSTARGTCKPTWGPTLPLRPFFGTTGVAPPARYGRCPAASRASTAATWTTRS
jgi:acetamidase/formamidase